ncbi:MAG: hypothetical protein ABI426_06665 [Flavobacterium sp.]
MKKLACLLLLLIVTISSYAQLGVNDYKYAQLPSKLEFQEVQNQYRINATIKFFLEQRGFVVYYDTDIQPQEFASTNCNKFFVNVVRTSTLFSTKIKIELKDCTNKVLVTSEEGVSRQKEFGAAYNEALRTALKSLERIKYNGKAGTIETVAITENKIVAKPVNVNPQLNQPLKIEGLLLSRTSNPEIYLAVGAEGKNGVVFKKVNDWFFEYYLNGKLVSEKLEVKF